MSASNTPHAIRFRLPSPSHEGVLSALEQLAIAIAEADTETDEVEGFQFDMKGPISFGGGAVGQRPNDSLCIGYTYYGKGRSSCLVEWF